MIAKKLPVDATCEDVIPDEPRIARSVLSGRPGAHGLRIASAQGDQPAPTGATGHPGRSPDRTRVEAVKIRATVEQLWVGNAPSPRLSDSCDDLGRGRGRGIRMARARILAGDGAS